MQGESNEESIEKQK